MSDIIEELRSDGEDERQYQREARTVLRVTLDRAAVEITQLRAEVERLKAGLKKAVNACHQGRLVSLGAGGMTIDAQIKNSVYHGVPAWPIAEAEEVLDAALTAQEKTDGK